MITRRRAFWACRAAFLVACLLSSQFIAREPSGADLLPGREAEIVHGLAADIWRSRNQMAEAAGRRQLLSNAIEAKTNVDLLSRLVLGRHWRSLKPADRDEYRALFSKVVIGGLAGRLDILLDELDGPLEQHFAIKSSGAVGKRDVLVRSEVVAADGQSLSVDWRLRRLESGPVIIDLIVEGISLLVSQRAEFAAVVERGQIVGLLQTLRRRAGAGGS
ncbi:MAG: ABC transporter substrate-binding protein [Pseudomonadota bacterium]